MYLRREGERDLSLGTRSIKGVSPRRRRAERKVCLSQWPRRRKALSCKEMGGVSDVYFCLATRSQLLPQQPSTSASQPPLS